MGLEVGRFIIPVSRHEKYLLMICFMFHITLNIEKNVVLVHDEDTAVSGLCKILQIH
jgi:hypothetical protein